jgi:hypothetical protein
VLSAALLAPGSALAAGVPNPVVWGPIQGGIRGFPGNASTYPLSGPGYDYAENEYFFSGTATDRSNGQTASYVTRMLVRVPRDPAKFNGIMLVDWPNVTDQEDFEFTWWAPAHTYLMQQGYGYAIISAQQVGVNHLKIWDPERYALLAHPGDAFAQDIFAQGIQALRDPQDNATSPQYPNVVDPTGGLHVRYVVAGGVSQSAGELATFINNGYNRGIVDAYNIERDLGSTYNDFSTFIFSMDEETSFTGAPAAPRQPDNPHFRVWEEAGAAHEPISWWSYRLATQQKQGEAPPGVPDPVNTTCSVNRAPINYTDDAMLYWTQQYLTTGVEPPSAPRIVRTSSTDFTPVRDADGLAEGGLRHSFVQVPVALNTSQGCPFWGTYTPWSAAKIQSRYPTHCDYVDKVAAWDSYEVSQGWLLPQDSDIDIAAAEQFTTPWGSAPDCAIPALGTPPLSPGGAGGCPAATGRLTRLGLGPLRLGMTRARARHRLTHFSTRGRRAWDFFCLAPVGIRAGYANAKMLRGLRRAQRSGLGGRIVILLSSDRRYSLRGVHTGARLRKVARQLRISRLIRIGANDWYITPNGASHEVIRVRHGVIQEIGIANKFLTRNYSAARQFLRSLP